MSSPWEPAIPQAMQRHGGSTRSIPKAVQPKPEVREPPRGGPAVQEAPGREDRDAGDKPEQQAG